MYGMKKISLVATLVAGFGFSTVGAAQTVYKSVDEEGNVSFTDRPPMQQSVGESPLDVMELQIKLTDPTLIAANREAADEENSAREKVAAATAQAASDQAAQATRQAEERDANCQLAKERLTRYANANRLYKEGDNGERLYLDDSEIDAERMKAARAVDQWCGS